MRQAIFLISAILVVATSRAFGQCDKSSFSIVLLGDFHEDRAEVIIDNKKVFDKIITSDGSTDLAGSCSFKKVSCRQKVVIIINGHQMHVIYLDHAKIHKQLLGIWKFDKSISTTFYDIPLILE